MQIQVQSVGYRELGGKGDHRSGVEGAEPLHLVGCCVGEAPIVGFAVPKQDPWGPELRRDLHALCYVRDGEPIGNDDQTGKHVRATVTGP